MEYLGNWHYPTEIKFGVGRIRELPHWCQGFQFSRPLFVVDPGLLDKDFVRQACLSFEENKISATLFSDFKSNPTGANVDAGVAAYRQVQCDGVVALGGGSALDTAKAIALMCGQTRSIWDFEDIGDNYLRADAKKIAKIIAIPTTSGTGSEVGRASVILNEKTHRKVIIFHPAMLPSLVLADPGLTLGLPPGLTAATGMDALAHNLEAWCAPGFHPLADGIALEGMRLIKENLPQAVADGNDIDARANMMAAAIMGATAFQKGLGAVHSLSHPVGALYDKHHGLLNAIFMPYVLAFNRELISEKLIRLARYLDFPPNDTSVMNWIVELCKKIGIPDNLQAIGVDVYRADEVAAMALCDPSTPTNPKPLTEKNLREIFVSAVTGKR